MRPGRDRREYGRETAGADPAAATDDADDGGGSCRLHDASQPPAEVFGDPDQQSVDDGRPVHNGIVSRPPYRR
jgi:hypothetical protein